MAVAIEHGVCVHCEEPIALRVYANSVKLWTSGNGKFPGDQRFCEEHIIDDEGSIGDHEPVERKPYCNHCDGTKRIDDAVCIHCAWVPPRR